MKLTKLISLDCETTGLSCWHGNAPFAVSLCNSHGDTEYLQWPVNPHTRAVRAPQSDIRYLRSILENPKIAIVGHNLKFDMRMLRHWHGIRIAGRVEETMFLARVINSIEDRIGLKALGEIYLDIPKNDEQELHKVVQHYRLRGKREGLMCGPPRYEVQQDYWIPTHYDKSNNLCEVYARQDAERTMLFFLLMEEQLDKLDVRDIYEMELALQSIVTEMEDRGIPISLKRNNSEIDHNANLRDHYLSQLRSLSGKPDFNPNSYAQTLALLRVRGIIVNRTNWKTLLPYRNDPFVYALFGYKIPGGAIKKYFNSYKVKAAYDRTYKTYVIHSNFNQAGTKTGRASASDPNMQNATTREPQIGVEMPRVRYPFRPRKNYNFYFADYSQVELRIFADYSQEPTMLAAIAAGRDIHAETANKAWGGLNNPAAIKAAIGSLELLRESPSSPAVRSLWNRYGYRHPKAATHADRGLGREIERIALAWLATHKGDIVSAEKSLGKETIRSRAKEINFAKIYGSGPNGVKDLLFVSYDEAKKFLVDYDKAMPQIKKFIYQTADSAAAHNYTIRNAYGRLLRVPPDKAYKAVNYLVQGSAADLMKYSMISVNKFLTKHKYDFHLLFQIHDELMFEGSRDENVTDILKGIQKRMSDHGGIFGVPLPTSISVASKSWAIKEKMEL